MLASIGSPEVLHDNGPFAVQRHCEEACNRDEATILGAAITYMILKIVTPSRTRQSGAEYLRYETRHIVALTTTLATNLWRHKSYQS